MTDQLKRKRGSGKHLNLPAKVQVGFATHMFEQIKREADAAQCTIAAIVRQRVARTFVDDGLQEDRAA